MNGRVGPIVATAVAMLLFVGSADSQERTRRTVRMPGVTEAEQAYLRYRQVVQSATTLDEVMPFWGAALRGQFTGMSPGAQRVALHALQQTQAALTDVRITGWSLGVWGGIGLDLEGAQDGVPMMGFVATIEEKGGTKLYRHDQWLPMTVGRR